MKYNEIKLELEEEENNEENNEENTVFSDELDEFVEQEDEEYEYRENIGLLFKRFEEYEYEEKQENKLYVLFYFIYDNLKKMFEYLFVKTNEYKILKTYEN